MVCVSQKGDGRECGSAGVNTFRGVARDLILYFEKMEPTPVVVIHSTAVDASDKAVDLSKSNTQVCIGHTFDKPKTDAQHVNVLVTGKTKAHCDKAICRLDLRASTTFAAC